MSTLISFLLFFSTHFSSQPQTTVALVGKWGLIKMVFKADTLFNRDNRGADSILYFNNVNIRQRFAHDSTYHGDIKNFNELRKQTARIYMEIYPDSLLFLLPDPHKKNGMEPTPALYYAPIKNNATTLYHDKEMSDDPFAELMIERDSMLSITMGERIWYFKNNSK